MLLMPFDLRVADVFMYVDKGASRGRGSALCWNVHKRKDV